MACFLYGTASCLQSRVYVLTPPAVDMQSGGPLAKLAGGHRKTLSMTEPGQEGEGRQARKRHRRKKKVQKQTVALRKKLRFGHVRLNRVILRITFQVRASLGPARVCALACEQKPDMRIFLTHVNLIQCMYRTGLGAVAVSKLSVTSLNVMLYLNAGLT